MSETLAQPLAFNGTGDLVNRLTSELAQVQRALANAQQKLGATTRTLQARTLELGDARTAVDMLLATLDSDTHAVLVMGTHGRSMNCNALFERLWGVGAERLRSLNAPALLALQLSQVRDPARFLAQVEHEQAKPDEEHRSEVELADGRVLERHIVPHGARGRRVGFVTRYRDRKPS
ncbi:MAG TPA: hypothetical protein VEA40_08630 [Ramlibacter sp.]|nr:hypothetical protein [Ramlibacter sp.]